MTNSPSASVALPVRAELFWAKLASAAVRRALACSSAARASRGASLQRRSALVKRSARSRSRVASTRAVCASARARSSCGRSAGAEGGRQQPGEFLAARTGAPTTTPRPASAVRRSEPQHLRRRRVAPRARRNANRFTNCLFLHERGPKSRLHCCSLRKLMPGDSLQRLALRTGPRQHSGAHRLDRRGVRRSIPTTGARSRRSRFPACVGTSTPKIPGRDGASTRKTSGWAEPPSSRTSTFPSVSALNVSSLVK